MSVIVRFAPSPTGNLHIGGARTAIFNYLYAKSMGGKFYLRIEDTDYERSKKEFEDEIIHSMKWLGMNYDGDLTYQSKRTDIYKKYVDKLLESGSAYYCSCSKENLEAEREHLAAEKKSTNYSRKCRGLNLKKGVVRFKAPETGITKINDLILGEISINNEQIEDFVIARADGTPTYNFTVVVDDYEMGITHVIRGDDHVNNTPKQLLLFKALGLTPPEYAHVPMILGADGKKLSKRHGATAVSQYRKDGYLPEALLNYLVRLGWSHGDQEIFTKTELETCFDISSIGKSSSILNIEKLDWLNAHYIKNKNSQELAKLLVAENFLESSEKLFSSSTLKLIDLAKERAKKLSEIAVGISYILEDELKYDKTLYGKYFEPILINVFPSLISELSKLAEYKHEKLELIFKEVLDRNNIKMKQLAQAVRVLLTGTDRSPGIYELIEIFGKNLTLQRLNNFTKFYF